VWGCLGRDGFCWRCNKYNEGDEDESTASRGAPSVVDRSSAMDDRTRSVGTDNAGSVVRVPGRLPGLLGRARSLKPWQHVVEWPDEKVWIDEIELQDLNGLRGRYTFHEYHAEMAAYRATKLGTGGRILVTEDHDGGDEQ
jgi:hypothetical protein